MCGFELDRGGELQVMETASPTPVQLAEAERLAGDEAGQVWGHDAGSVRLHVGDEHWRIWPDGSSKRV